MSSVPILLPLALLQQPMLAILLSFLPSLMLLLLAPVLRNILLHVPGQLLMIAATLLPAAELSLSAITHPPLLPSLTHLQSLRVLTILTSALLLLPIYVTPA